MKFYYWCIAALEQYKRGWIWMHTHRSETVDNIFITGLLIALAGFGLLFASGEKFWILFSGCGILLVIIAKTLLDYWVSDKRSVTNNSNNRKMS